MEEGYLQNKIREQAEKMTSLENKIKELEIMVIWSKKNWEDAASLMWKCAETDNFKKQLTKEVIETIKPQTQKTIEILYKTLDKNLVVLGEALLEREKRSFNSFTASLSRVLIEKSIFTIEDVKKFIEYQNDFYIKKYNKEGE